MNLLKTLVTISGITMISRITGLIREIIIAHIFGAGPMTDAFAVAFRLPNLLRRLFAEGAFSQAFVPILAEYKNQRGTEDCKTLIDHVCCTLLWATILTSLAGIIATPFIINIIAGGFSAHPQTYAQAVLMTRMMFPYIVFMAFVALAGGILNTWSEFKIPAFTPALLNLSFILATIFLAPYLKYPIHAQAWAAIIGGILQVSLQIPALIKIGMLPRLRLNPFVGWSDSGVRRILRKMGPAVFAVSAAQISILINTSIASNLTVGSITWLTYADRLMEFPTALLGVALSTILLPNLSKATTLDNQAEYSALLDWGLRLCFLLALPAAVGLATLAEPLTATLFHHGHFNEHDVAMTARALVAYGVGLSGIILVKILAPAFYAKQDLRTPVKIAVGIVIVTQLLNLIFVPLFAVSGLALSIGLAACFNAGLLYFGLRRRALYCPMPGWKSFFTKLFFALFLMVGVSLWAANQVNWLSLTQNQLLRSAHLTWVIALSTGSYFGALWLMGFRVRDFKRNSA